MNFESLKKILHLTSKICLTVFTFLFALLMVAGAILMENKDTISQALGQATTVTVKDPDAQSKDLEYYKSAFDNLKDVKNNGRVYAESVVDEGATLLKNSDKDGKPVLPLKSEGATVSLFSTSSVSPILSGTGSGGGGTENVSLLEGLEDAGIAVNKELYEWYDGNQGKYGRKWPAGSGGVGKFATVGDATWDQLPDAKNKKADAAIFVLSRSGGEGMDLTSYNKDNKMNVFGSNYEVDYKDGNYLKISDTERDVLTNMCRLRNEGVFGSVIVLMNSANPVELEFIDALGIDALMWVGSYGSQGAYAVGELLNGNINPSGKLSDTFWKHHYLNPVLANFGSLTNGAEDPLVNQWRQARPAAIQNAINAGGNGDIHNDSVENIVYQEGIYMGYRYTETRYEDVVLNRGNAGDFKYYDAVSYPFGYGLSYTKFAYSDLKVQYVPKESDRNLKDSKYVVQVTVKNTGGAAGKEAVQLYLQKPYIAGGIEKSAVDLVDFGKTPLLEPGASATLTMEVDGRDLASYDAYGAKGYVVDEGTYYLTVATDAHNAVNNILAAKEKTTADGMTENGNKAMVYSFAKTKDVDTYKVSTATGKTVTNQFDNADLKLYDGAGDNEIEYISRNDWEKTVKYGLNEDNTRTYDRVIVKPTEKMKEDLDKSWGGVGSCGGQPTLLPEEAKGGEYPTFGSTKTAYSLVMLRAKTEEVDDGDPTNDEWIAYDDPLWDDLLDQMTWKELVDLLSYGQRTSRAVASIGKPDVIDHNGGNGPNQSYTVMSGINNGLAKRKDDPMKGESPVVYPCNGIVASTFNKELCYYYGCQWGEDMLWAGMAGLYGMGLNTHRSAYGGRNFEYYSEDPVLMGVIAGETTKGMATRGAYVYLKHCVLNEQETYRCGGFTWANEQSIREIYLRSYEIAIADYGAQCVMGGLNSIGMMGTGVQGFFNTVLRDEYGMTGLAVTDTTSAMGANFAVAVFYGNDLPDGGVNDDAFDFAKPVSEGGKGEYGNFAWAMRESAHRILYTVVHSNAMNGFAAGDKIYTVTPPWVTMVTALQIVTGILFGLSVVALGVSVFLNRKEFFCGGKQE